MDNKHASNFNKEEVERKEKRRVKRRMKRREKRKKRIYFCHF